MVMSWRRIFKSLQAVVAHGLLFSFTLFLSLKLCRAVNYSWWLIFSPLWLFHAVVARGRFSLPAPSMPHGRHWAPFHAIVAPPLLVAFELLLCVHLERRYDVNLKMVFLPLLALETTILVDNIRMCRALLPGDDECITDEAIWETLPHFWVAISMVFFIAATAFTLLKLCGDVAALGWWDLFINYGGSHLTRAGSSATSIRYLSSSSSMMAFSDEDQQNRVCSLQDIGGHIMKIPFVVFQLMLFMHLEGTPPGAKHIPIPVLFSPLLLLQGAGFLFAIFRFLEKIILLLHHEGDTGSHFIISQSARDYFDFLHHGSRFLGWWSIDEGSREEQAQLYCAGELGYNTFSPDSVKKMPKADLANEIWRLQEALAEQTEISKISLDEFERLQNEKILCRICFGEQINVVLLPCRHHVLCSTCCEKCKKCPICRVYIEDRLPVYDV